MTHECVVNYQWNNEALEGELFIDSSFILPNDFESIKQDIEALDSFINVQPEKLRNTFDVSISQLEMKNNITGFEKRVKENEFKTVQIVAMFVSIASFVLLNVKIFDEKSSMESFGIILGLASCFFVFNIFFYLIILPHTQGWKAFGKFIVKSIFLISFPIGLAFTSYNILSKYGTKKNDKSDNTKTSSDVNLQLYNDTTKNPTDSVVKPNKTISIDN
jgi:hypothetical protein